MTKLKAIVGPQMLPPHKATVHMILPQASVSPAGYSSFVPMRACAGTRQPHTSTYRLLAANRHYHTEQVTNTILHFSIVL